MATAATTEVTVIGYFQSAPSHIGPNTKSEVIDKDKEIIQDWVDYYYGLGAMCVEVDGKEVANKEEKAEAK